MAWPHALLRSSGLKSLWKHRFSISLLGGLVQRALNSGFLEPSCSLGAPPYLLHTAHCTRPSRCGSRGTEHLVAWRAHSGFLNSGLQVWCTHNEFRNSGHEITAPGAMGKEGRKAFAEMERATTDCCMCSLSYLWLLLHQLALF